MEYRRVQSFLIIPNKFRQDLRDLPAKPMHGYDVNLNMVSIFLCWGSSCDFHIPDSTCHFSTPKSKKENSEVEDGKNKIDVKSQKEV